MSAFAPHYTTLLRYQLSKDAPYAWFLLDHAKGNSRYHLKDFQEQAQRLEAYLAALGLALQARQAPQDWLSPGDWGSLFVLATLGIRHQRPELFERALDNLNEKEETHPRELIDACLWDGPCASTPWLEKLYTHPSPVARAAWIGLARATHLAPDPERQAQLGADEDPKVRAQLLAWLGEQGNAQQLPIIARHYHHQDPDLAFAAARAGLLQGDADARTALAPFTRAVSPHLPQAVSLGLLGAQDPHQVSDWIERLWQRPEIPIRIKLHATAVAGLPEHIDKLFAPMAEEETGRAAGEAFTTLTGADLEDQDLDAPAGEIGCGDKDKGEEEDSPEPSLAERRKKDPFISAWEDDLPDPCPEATERWWQSHRSAFTDAVQYLAGQETTKANLQHILRTGNQRQRQLAADHLFFNRQAPWRDCGWPPAYQRRFLGAADP